MAEAGRPAPNDDAAARDGPHVRCEPQADGWLCHVRVASGGSATEHAVRVRQLDLDRLDPGSSDPLPLVRASFAFLLERESTASILRDFDLRTISRYFREYETHVGAYLGRARTAGGRSARGHR